MLANTFGKLLAAEGPVTASGLEFLNEIINALNTILVPILIIVATAGTIYAVVLGVNMARAESAEKREEAKKRVINAVVALAIMIVLILVLRLFISVVPTWGLDNSISDYETSVG